MKKNSGFTIIELVVVIAIIGVLASVIAPRVRLSLMKAKDAKVVATLDTLRTASNLYYAETGNSFYGTIPTGGVADSPVTIGAIKTLISAGYLEDRGNTLVPLDANDSDQFSLPAGVVQKYSENCDAVGTPKSNADFTPGTVPFAFGADGIAINILKTGSGEPFVDTGCNYWNSK